jgi:CheY-like chemotaxis protein
MAVPRVLIVDKDHESCAYVSNVLADSGFHVDVASDAQTTLQKCKLHDVLLIEFLKPRPLPEMVPKRYVPFWSLGKSRTAERRQVI